MRRKQPNSPAGFCYPMQFGDERHHVRHMLNDVIRDDKVEFIVGERIWNFAKIVNNVGMRARTYVKPDRTLNLVYTAADV